MARTTRWALGAAVVAATALAGAEAEAQFVFQVEGATVTKSDTYVTPTWDVVNMQFAYQTPIIFAVPNTDGANPADFRIRNVTGTSFELTLAEPPSEDGPHVAMDIAYVAVEEGQWSLPDGQQMAAGKVTTNQLIFKGGGGTITVPLPPGFVDPVVFAQIQGQANEQNNVPSQPSNPFLTAAVLNVTPTSFELALDGVECTSTPLGVPEEVGWLAVDANVVSTFVDTDNKTINYRTIRTGSAVPGWDQGSLFVPFGPGFTTTPLFVAQLQTRNEDDGGWLRFLNPAPFGVALRVDEDRCQDPERFHVGEQGGLFVFSENFRIQDPDPDGDGIASSLDNCPFIANPGQGDSDVDGRGDVCDNCPTSPNANQADGDGNGLGDACDCGDGIVHFTETCDDGNGGAGDGCFACGIETGWTCSGSPSVCTPICGDGLILGGEACDDGDIFSGDGCSSSCTVENGYTCNGEPSVCVTNCGDGVVANVEACDDANVVDGDGCSGMCSVEEGFSCTGEPSVCTPGCGDGIVAGSEECDDGNNVDGDGCSSICEVEPMGTGGGGMGGTGGAGGAEPRGSTTTGAGGARTTSAGVGGDPNQNLDLLIAGRGCACRTRGGSSPRPWGLFVLPLALWWRRRRR